MTFSTPLTALPPPLAILRDTPAGAVYALASKNHLLEGIAACQRYFVTDAEWLDGRNAFVLDLQARHRVTFAAAGSQLTTECTCREWSPGRQCSHVVTGWALLKRAVSPESFATFRFSDRLLRNVERLVGLEDEQKPPTTAGPSVRATLINRLEEARAVRAAALKEKKPAAKPYNGNIRLVLEIRDGHIFGTIRKGSEQLYGWGVLPADLRIFMSRHYFFEPTGRFFKDFSALQGKYPIVLRQGNGSETPLAFRDDAPLRAGITFSLDQGSVRVTRCLADGSPLPAQAVVAGECLIDPAEKTIHQVSDLEPWKLWDTVLDGSDTHYELTGEPYDYAGATLTTGAQAFNYAAIRVSPVLLKKLGNRCRFIANGEEADPAVTHSPLYFLEIEDAPDEEVIGLAPWGELAGVPFPFSMDTFRLFIPGFRSGLPQPLRAKKRVTAMIETGFALLETTTTTARDALLRRGLGGPDFTRRAVKADAKQLVNAFAHGCEKNMLLIFATPDGWRFGIEERITQARLIRLLYDRFGIDPFVDGDAPCSLELRRETLLPRLGELAVALGREGFDLHLRGEPLAAANWDFTVTANAAGIDWFELRPEIRCNGELLALEEIRQLLEGGIVRQGSACYLLGDEQRRILELLVAFEGGKGKRKKKGEIVRIPRLQILDWLELRAHGVSLRLPPEEEKLLAGLTRLEQIPERPLPAGLKADLRHYQKEGGDWLAFLHEHRFGACLADDMGLGKTVQAIAFLAGLAEGTTPSAATERLPHLVVVPPSLLFNWESEIARFYPAFRVVTYAGQKRSIDFAGADIVLTSYGILQRDADILASIPFHVAVFDEAQQVKNIHAATTGAARRITARFRLALTGTPMENHLGEYFAIMDLCVPGLLGSYEEFRRRTDIRGFGGVDTLVRRTRPFILRRSKQMIADELPPRVEADLYLEMTPKQRALYQRTVEEVRGAVDEAFRVKSPGQARMIALTAILRLRQICLCPTLVSSGSKADSPKLECLAEQLLELKEEGHSVLVFSQFTSYLDIIEAGLKHHRLPFLRLDGSTPVAKRKGLVSRFQKSDEPLVFLISLKAGGKGLNLTRATYVYHLDPWWNPAVENQASDRAHRIGQTEKVTVTRLLMRHTVEEKMMALKERKLKLYKALLDDAMGAGGAALSKEDFDFLLAP
ncbi:MAG: non-specific serine/threonine protein [Geobacteraceae bacterium]|nr:MAG: non-specific serine/threonine protein [Geobacteraceae bacterium]